MNENQTILNTEEIIVDYQNFDHTVIHSDEFYNSYVKNFEQNKKKRLFIGSLKDFLIL